MHRLTKLALSAVFVASGLAANASTITGTVFSTAAYPAPLNPSQTPGSIPGTTTYGTFTVNQIDFLGTGGPSYTVGGFLNSNGSVATLNPGLNGSLSLDNKEIQFMGSNYFAAGTYDITHDDGVFLYLNGMQVLAAGSPTSAETSSFTVTTSGVYSFDLLYAEVNGAPGVLDFPAATTPEPSSLALFGTGILGVYGAARRRFARS